jgi:predicted CopG family antitoxin
MAYKTISLTENAYKLLKKEKRKNESFSKVIERLINKKENPWLMMQNKFDPVLLDGLKGDLRKIREKNLSGGKNHE